MFGGLVIKREVVFLSNNRIDKSVASDSWAVWGEPQCGSKTKNNMMANKHC
jgi:hypothetical protein